MQETLETQVWSLGGEDPLEVEMATHSMILAWKISWTEEPDRLQSKRSHRDTGIYIWVPVYVAQGHIHASLTDFISLGPLQRRRWHPTPVLLPGKSHGRKSLVGCSPWGREESDMTERLHFHFSLSCIGEGNGNPLQCSCLENPRDRGAWWAAVCGVSQSRTRLKRLSSSSSNTI